MVDPDGRTIDAVNKATTIIHLLGERGSMRAGEVAAETGFTEATVYNHLRSLMKADLVMQRANADKYRLSTQFLRYGDLMRKSWMVHTYGRPVAHDLAGETGEHVTVGVPYPNKRAPEAATRVYDVEGERAVSDDRPLGDPLPPHATALGKTVLSRAESHHRDQVLGEASLPAETEFTTTDPDGVRADWDRTRDRGYAVETQEYTAGIGGVAVPIEVAGTVVGMIGAVGPIGRFDDEYRAHLGRILRDGASTVEVRLQLD